MHQPQPLVSEFEPGQFEFQVYSKTVTVENTPVGPGPNPNPDPDPDGPTPQSPVRPDPPTTIIPDPVPLAEIDQEEIPLAAPAIEISDEIIPLAAVPKTGIGHVDYRTILRTNYVVTVDAIVEDKKRRK